MFKKWSEAIRQGIGALGRLVKGAYQIVKEKKYRDRYIEVSGQDPFLCRYCGHEMVLWKLWHPKNGAIYDEYENLKAEKYGPIIEQEDGGGGGYPVRPPSGGIQLSLFPLPT